jgi:hypothetical protein
VTALYAQLAKQGGGERLPVVVPMIIYNGDAPWQGPLRFSELLDGPASLRAFVVDFKVVLVDVGAEPIETLSAHATLRGGLLGLKAAATPAAKLPAVLREMVLSLRGDESTRSLFLDYLLKVAGPEVLPSIERARREVDEENEMQTAAQFLDHRGYNRGMRHGLKKGLETATEMIRGALRQALSGRFRRIPKAVQAQIDEADAKQLTAWIAALGEAKTLKALFGN